MSEAVFRLAYDGDAVRHGEMDAADLAPALLGLVQMLKAAGQVVEGDAADVSVRVKSTREACFEVWFTVAVEGANSVWTWWKTPDVQAAAALLQVLGISVVGGGYGALQVVRRLKGKRPGRVTATTPGNVSLEVDGDVIEVPDMVARIALDSSVRAAMEKVIADPLEKDGIEAVSIGPDGGERIPQDEAESFRAVPADGKDEFVSRHTKAFSIVSLSFKPGQKWRLSDGGAVRQVKMSDEDFAARVDRSEVSFAKGDLLVCEVIETSRRTPTGFKSEYEIVKVVEHRQAVVQQPLGLDGPTSPTDSS